jgi:general secretion pathway protein L
VLQAAPHLLEEFFAEDVELLHFALGRRQVDGNYPIAAISLQRLRQWLDLLETAGVRPSVIAPDALCLPWNTEGPWFALVDEGDSLLVRHGRYKAFSAATAEFPLLLDLADGGDEKHPVRILVNGETAVDFTSMDRPVELLPGYRNPIDALMRHYQPERSIDLLQGAYARRQDWVKYLLPWKQVAILAAVALLLGLIDSGIRINRLNHSASALEDANLQRFAEVLPNDRPTAYLDEQLQGMIRHAQAGGGNSGLFFLVGEFAQAQAAAPGLTLRTLEYRDGALLLDLTGSDLEVLEKLRNWFSGHPEARLEVQSADSGTEGVQIRLKLSAAA